MNTTHGEEFWHNVAFPLPYRIFLLIGVGLLGWAANLHVLDLCNIDVVAALDLRTEEGPPRLPTSHRGHTNSMTPALIKATYHVFLAYSSLCGSSWLLYRLGTRGDPFIADAYGHIPAITALILILVIINPHEVLFKSERDKFVQAIRRCLFSSMTTPILFADVVFADIGTSFAKVFGDVWLSLCMFLPGNSLLTPPVHEGIAKWVLPTAMSLPYFVRFRQCIIEYNLPSNDSNRPFFNAIKYATAFPVIFLSAAQRVVVIDANEKEIQAPKAPWHGESYVFRLWLLAVFVNSAYSFWWDLTNDWGLELLRSDSSVINERQAPKRLILPQMQSTTPLITRPSSPTQAEFDNSFRLAGLSPRKDYPYGLRSILLYPRAIYPVLIACNFVLRMSWSVKLSSHLHSARDGSVAVFWLEVAEIVRRWLWVFVRVEWEVVKKMQDIPPQKEEADILLIDDSNIEMITPNGFPETSPQQTPI